MITSDGVLWVQEYNESQKTKRKKQFRTQGVRKRSMTALLAENTPLDRVDRDRSPGREQDAGPRNITIPFTHECSSVWKNPITWHSFEYSCRCHYLFQSILATVTCSAPCLASVVGFAVQAFLSHYMELHIWCFPTVIAKDPNLWNGISIRCS